MYLAVSAGSLQTILVKNRALVRRPVLGGVQDDYLQTWKLCLNTGGSTFLFPAFFIATTYAAITTHIY